MLLRIASPFPYPFEKLVPVGANTKCQLFNGKDSRLHPNRYLQKSRRTKLFSLPPYPLKHLSIYLHFLPTFKLGRFSYSEVLNITLEVFMGHHPPKLQT